MMTSSVVLQNAKENKGFIKFVMPSILSMVFLSFYTIVDGIFVAKYSGPIALAGMNIVLPLFNLAGGLGIMAATGGSALVGIALGEGKRDEANRMFSMVSAAAFGLSVVLMLAALVFFDQILLFLGVTTSLQPFAYSYGKMVVWMIPVFILKVLLEYFMRIDGKPNLSLVLSISGGVINIVLDWYFMAQLQMGVGGAALATAIGSSISVLIGLWYFAKKSQLKFTLVKWHFKTLANAAFNGSSEMFTELSTGITTYIFNITAIKLAGENGLAALSVLMYSHFLLMSVFLGLSSGVAPLISLALGAKEKGLLNLIDKRSRLYIIAIQCVVTLIAITQADLMAGIFLSKGTSAYLMTVDAIRIFAVAFIVMGVNIYESARHTAMNNGLWSAIIAIQRSLIGTLIGIVILPVWFGVNGLWIVIPFAEVLAFITVIALRRQEKKQIPIEEKC